MSSARKIHSSGTHHVSSGVRQVAVKPGARFRCAAVRLQGHKITRDEADATTRRSSCAPGRGQLESELSSAYKVAGKIIRVLIIHDQSTFYTKVSFS